MYFRPSSSPPHAPPPAPPPPRASPEPVDRPSIALPNPLDVYKCQGSLAPPLNVEEGDDEHEGKRNFKTPRRDLNPSVQEVGARKL